MTGITALRGDGTPQIIADAMEAVQDRRVPIEDRAALYGVLHQVQLRINRAIKGAKDDIIAAIKAADGELGPLTIKTTGVDPRYVCNDPENWDDATIQDAFKDMTGDPELRTYIRAVPAHYEIDVLTLVGDVQLGVASAIALYRELNRRRWRVERDRRESIAVREVTKVKAA